MAAPPLLAGAENVTVAWPAPAVAVPITGAPGAKGPPAVGVTELEAAEGAPVPTPLVAVTVKVYAVPLASAATTIDVHGAVHVPVMPLGLDVAV